MSLVVVVIAPFIVAGIGLVLVFLHEKKDSGRWGN